MRVIIATDGSIYSQAAVEKFCRLFAGISDLHVTVVSTYEVVVPLDAFATTAQFSEERNQAMHAHAEKCVTEAADTIKKSFPNAEIKTEIAMDFPERFIVERAEADKADLVVVGSHGRGFWGRLTLGSVSGAVTHHAPCSVLIVRKKATAEKE